MKIVQKINSTDLVKFNQYLLDKNLSFKFSTYVLGALSLITSIASIVYEIVMTGKVGTLTIVICSILLVLGVFAIFFLKHVLKAVIKKRVLKKNEQIDPIRVTLSEAGLMWEYDNEEQNKTEAKPYTWNTIAKAVEKEEYIYIHINQYIVLFIKKNECVDLEETIKFLKEKLTIHYKYK